MRKVSAVGLVIGVLFLVVVFGIASIPDAVLESNSIEKSDGPIITVPKAPQIVEPETPEVAEPETNPEESEGKIIRVQISDGVGTTLR